MAEEYDKKFAKTFFSEISPRYPSISEDGKINTIKFLEASKSLVKLYDHFGRAFFVAKKDMEGNVDKLYKVYNKLPEKYSSLNDLIIHEKDDKTLYAIDALLWLRRALEFILKLIRKIFLEKREKTQNVSQFVLEAYTEVLKPYHGWIVQNSFKVLIKTFPYRTDIVKALTFGSNPPHEDDLCKHMEEYFTQLDLNLRIIKGLYDELGLNIVSKV